MGRRIERVETLNEGGHAHTERKCFVWQELRLAREIRETAVSSYLYSPEAAYTPPARIDQQLAVSKTEVVGTARDFNFYTELIGTSLEVTDEAGELGK